MVDLFDGTGTHDVLRIRLCQTGSEPVVAAADETAPLPRFVLLPFAKAMVPVVDLARGRMEVDPPKGLLDLAAPAVPTVARTEHRGRRQRRRQRPRAGGGGSSEQQSEQSS